MTRKEFEVIFNAVIIVVLTSAAAIATDRHQPKKHNHLLFDLCSKECPAAVSVEEIGACVAGKKSEPKFQPSACSIASDKAQKKK